MALNPLKWPTEQYGAFSASIIVGAAIGTVFGFMHSARNYSLNDWFMNRTSDAFSWAIVGAVIVGGTVYARFISK